MRFKTAVLAVVPFVFSASVALGGNIVLNSNFGTGDFTDWTANGDSSFPWGVGSGSGAFSGDTNYASTGCVGAQCIDGTTDQLGSLSQMLTTTVGGDYTLSFEFSTQGEGTPNELQVLWDGTTVLDLGPGGTLGPISTYTLFSVPDLIGTGSDTLTFLGRQDPGFDALDNVCVSSDSSCASVSGVPEPASASLLLAGLAGLLGCRFRSRGNHRV
jgi:PEP-CTERM motif